VKNVKELAPCEVRDEGAVVSLKERNGAEGGIAAEAIPLRECAGLCSTRNAFPEGDATTIYLRGLGLGYKPRGVVRLSIQST